MTTQSIIGILFFFNIMLSLVSAYSLNQSQTFSVGYKLNNEKRLIEDLFKNYQVKFGRPVNNMTERVIVYFGIYLIQLIDLDERNQVLITNVHSIYVSLKLEKILNFRF